MTMHDLVELLMSTGLEDDDKAHVYLKEGDKIIPLLAIESYNHISNGTMIYLLSGEME